ncbi:MAG: TetR/AcrR family transcriptional regulator [Nitrospiraceae bacterium]|nr:TetR/AcrR family transcriptional regulator [Nitrospiraceae bacterium]
MKPPERSKEKAESRVRGKLVETAADLFYRHGIENVGINEVIERSGVARMSLYYHFKSKDDLILAVLDHAAEIRLTGLEESVGEGKDPGSRLLGAFRSLKGIVEAEGFRGCAFINAATERADPGDPIHGRVARYKSALREVFASLAKEAGAAQADLLAWQLLILWDGAVTEAYIQQRPDLVDAAVSAAETLIRSSLPPAGSGR